MNHSRLLRARDYPCMPWKNGGGTTLEVARDAGEGLESFGWRLSIADIKESGGFSAFTGYQRVITVLEGAGMRLNVDGRPSRDLGPLDAFAFDGGATVQCELIEGPIRDFNLIYSPARYVARLQWFHLGGEISFLSSANILLLFAAEDGVMVDFGGQASHLLGKHDCLQVETSSDLTELKLRGERSACCIIELTKR